MTVTRSSLAEFTDMTGVEAIEQSDGSVRLSFDEAAQARVREAVLPDRPYAGRVSLALAIRLGCAREMNFPVLDELDYLEGLSSRTSTRPATRFDRGPLLRFWHKHFTTARHIPRNLAIRWGVNPEYPHKPGKRGGSVKLHR